MAICLLVWTACSGDKADGEQYVGLVKSPEKSVPTIDVGKAAADAAELYRAVTIPHHQIAEWLGPHRFHGTTILEVEDPGKKLRVESLSDETAIDFDGAGYRAVANNSRNYGRHAWFVDGLLYLRPRFGAYHRRAPSDPAEPARIRDEIYGGVAAQLELLQSAVKPSDGGAATLAGRSARKIVLGLGEQRTVTEPLAHRKWREGTDVKEVSGEILLDDKTGVPLKASIRGAVYFERDGRLFVMKVEAHHEFSDFGQVPKLSPPTDGEIVSTPERARETDDRNTLLRGIAPPARRAPAPAAGPSDTTRPEGSPS